MILPYYNPQKKYSVDELKKIQIRLQKDINGCKKLREDLKADTTFIEADDALDCFLKAAESAQIHINGQL